MKLAKITPAELTTLETTLKQFNIPADWDYLIIGDGSGTVWDKEIGWASTLIENSTKKREIFFGSMSSGTNNIAEIMAVLHPLMSIANRVDSAAEFNLNGKKIHVISDSMYVVDNLNKTNPVWSALKYNKELWMAIHGVRRRGVDIFAHHTPRDTIDLNKLGHEIANICRRSQAALVNQILEHRPDIELDGLKDSGREQPSE